MEIKKLYYTTGEVQTMLAVSRTTANQIMHELEQEGHLLRRGNVLRVEAEAFEEWVRNHTANR